MTPFDCTHLVLYSSNLKRCHDFYAGVLGCPIRVFNTDILGVNIGRMFINFYPNETAVNASSVNHLGLELPMRRDVEAWFSYLRRNDVDMFLSPVQSLTRERQTLTTLEQLRTNQVSGPYRFYVHDPDGYQLELHAWEGADES